MADGTDRAERIEHADPPGSHTVLTLPSTLATVDVVERTALAFAGYAGFDGEMASHLALVAREAAVNAVVHGNRYAPDKQVTASFEAGENSLRITVADEGAGIDVASIPDPLAPENLLRSSGRGVFLMRSFMDEVSFRSLSPGTETTLIKRRTGLPEHLKERQKGEER